MKFLHLLGIVILLSVSISFTSLISSCTKTNTIYDTTIVIKHDTTIVKDSIFVIDSIYDITDGLVAYYSFNGG